MLKTSSIRILGKIQEAIYKVDELIIKVKADTLLMPAKRW
jgi:hypothetical protein